MKRSTINIAIIGFICFGALFMNACRKTGTGPPTITLSGDTTVHISLNSAYVDEGAIATDDKDGTDVISSDFSATNPNADLAGTYIIHYYTRDNDGNSATATRKVIVANDAQKIGGFYTVADTVLAGSKNAGAYTYTVKAVPSVTHNNEVALKNFAGLGDDVTVFSKISGDTVALSPTAQSPSGMNDPGLITGTGTVSGGNKITSFRYIITYISTGNDHGASYWTKQP